MEKVEVALSLGSNIGDSVSEISEASADLAEILENPVVSPFYRTEPVGYRFQSDFINAVVCGETSLSPESLLKQINLIEKKHKRVREIKFGPRTLDIDIIFYGEKVLNTASLTIPHPQYRNRLFVLVPLADLRPNLVDPVEKKKIKDILEEVRKSLNQKIERL